MFQWLKRNPKPDPLREERGQLMFNLQCSHHAFEKHRYESMRGQAMSDCAAILDHLDRHGDPDEQRAFIRTIVLDLVEIPCRHFEHT